VKPVLDAIDALYAELVAYPPGDRQFEKVRAHLENVLLSVKKLLTDECSQYDDSMTYLAWQLQSIE
jgi:hypothetical protein